METYVVNIADLINPESGKSYRQENNEKNHKYKVGDLVEIIFCEDGCEDDCKYCGMRLYIIGCVRDCDGTPLYVLGTKRYGFVPKGYRERWGFL